MVHWPWPVKASVVLPLLVVIVIISAIGEAAAFFDSAIFRERLRQYESSLVHVIFWHPRARPLEKIQELIQEEANVVEHLPPGRLRVEARLHYAIRRMVYICCNVIPLKLFLWMLESYLKFMILVQKTMEIADWRLRLSRLKLHLHYIIDSAVEYIHTGHLQPSLWSRIEAGRETAADIILSQVILMKILCRILLRSMKEWDVHWALSWIADKFRELLAITEEWKNYLRSVSFKDVKKATPRLTRTLSSQAMSQIKSLSRTISRNAVPFTRTLLNRFIRQIWQAIIPTDGFLDIAMIALFIIWFMCAFQSMVIQVFTFQLMKNGISVSEFIWDIIVAVYISVLAIICICKLFRRIIHTAQDLTI